MEKVCGNCKHFRPGPWSYFTVVEYFDSKLRRRKRYEYKECPTISIMEEESKICEYFEPKGGE